MPVIISCHLCESVICVKMESNDELSKILKVVLVLKRLWF